MTNADLIKGVDAVLAANARAEAYVKAERLKVKADSPEDMALCCIEGEFRKVRHAMLAVKSKVNLDADMLSGKFRKAVENEAKGHDPHRVATVEGKLKRTVSQRPTRKPESEAEIASEGDLEELGDDA